MVLNPTLQLTYFSLLVKFAYGTPDISEWIIGNAFLLAGHHSIFTIGNLLRFERLQGTLKYVLGSPVNSFTVFLSRSVFHIGDMIVRLVLGFLIGSLLFGFNYSSINLLTLSLPLLSGLLSGLGFGLLLSSIALLTTEVHMFLNSMEQLLIIFTGALFPLSRIPEAFRWLSDILPLSRSIQAGKLLLMPDSSGYLNLVLSDTIYGVILIILGYIAFRVSQHYSRIRGTIELY